MSQATRAETSGAFTLGGLGLGGVYIPIGGFIFGAAGTVLAIRALHRDRDNATAVLALCLCTVDMALGFSAFFWSLLTGLSGIVTSPAPP